MQIQPTKKAPPPPSRPGASPESPNGSWTLEAALRSTWRRLKAFGGRLKKPSKFHGEKPTKTQGFFCPWKMKRLELENHTPFAKENLH